MKIRTALSVLPFVLVLTACSSGSEEPSSVAPSSPVTRTVQSTTTTTKATEPTLSKIGESVTNGGITLTVNSVAAASSISYREGVQRNVFADHMPREGGMFVVVDTTIENTGTKSMDLTCSYPVATVLADEAKRQFDTYDDLYRVEGNPECNESLQPGFSSNMKYVYEIPDTATPTLFGFYEPFTQDANDIKFIDMGTVPLP